MSCQNERKTLVYHDPTEIFEPKSAFSPVGTLDKWRVTSYETDSYSGKMISAIGDAAPEDITFRPNVKGWYKIYLELPAFSDAMLFIKLKSDEAFLMVHNQRLNYNFNEKFLWRCADLTDEEIILTRRKENLSRNSFLSGITLVPMTDEEVAEWKAEDSRTDTKSLYTTDDMHNRPYITKIETIDDWVATVLPFRHSDAEWFSVEELRVFAEGKCPTDPDNFAFARRGDRNVQKQFSLYDYDEVLRRVVEKGHEIGLKMSVSIRMAAWGMLFPYDQCYFDCAFIDEHPEWCCHDRDGEMVSSLSYAYPEVRRFLIDKMINMARSGCDAVTLIAHRAPPFVLFEKPVADMFFEKYGEYPYELPLDDERLNAVHCDIMTTFFRELREALDKAYGKRKIRIQLRGLYSLHANKYVGLDCERLAEEGLLDDLVSYPMAQHELFNDTVWKDDDPTRIDLEKYTAFTHTKDATLAMSGDFDFRAPFKNSKGELVGPESQQVRIDEWNAFEDKYGVKVYIDILPREMMNDEFKRRALELYGMGARRFALWDTYSRVWNQPMWNFVSKLGHKDELADMPIHEEGFEQHRVVKLGDKFKNRYNPNWGG